MVKAKPRSVEKHTYKNCKIEILQYDVDQEITIDKKAAGFGRDADTGAYISSEAPYQTFGTLEELAKAIIDNRQG